MPAERERAAAQAGVFTGCVAQRECWSGSEIVPGQLAWNALQHGEHGIVFGDDAANGFGGVRAERLQLAQEKKAEDVVDVGVEKNGSCDRRLANAVSASAGMKFRRGFDLRAQVGRSSEQKPRSGIGADGNLRLRAGLAAELPGAHGTTVGAGAVPLRKASASSRAENLDLHDGSVAAGGISHFDAERDREECRFTSRGGSRWSRRR